MIKHQIAAVLFDLDGTLLDTAIDMGLSLNLQLAHHGKKSLPLETIRPWVSHGAAALIKLGFNVIESDQEYESLRQEYLEFYLRNLAVETKLFSGMDKVLSTLEANNILWGIVTNKPEFLTTPLLKALQLDKRACTVICGDAVKPSKPNAKPMFLACKLSNLIPNQTIYVGDARRDIEAAKASGMLSVAAKYGYINESDDFDSWQPDLSIDCPEELLSILQLSA